ncbi:kinase-like domain-containing protein [Epithele typhae]|uniref:kinase-like domain-containing protein n=1 Tax=Epithele typhae TaxID=378194 RepID=UPI0020074456|nr:kinase-like domain-containing protein [Epithele typhae]KAH9931166.1 kinase-like domain-containing protein [Epithele typhae]
MKQQLKPWSALRHLPNDGIIGLFKASSLTLGKPAFWANVYVRRIGLDIVAKFPTMPSEARHIQAVRAHTSIPIPTLIRECHDSADPKDVCLVLEYVPGRTLDQCWSELSIFRKLWIIWKLRQYVKQLREIPHTTPWPGPLGDTPQTCVCEALFSPTDAGPFASYPELVDWFHYKYEVAQRMNKVVAGCGHLQDPGPFPSQSPLVFTHLDLSPRNVLLGDDGQVWLIDFGLSGFYPQWFEWAMMYEWVSLGWIGRFARRVIAGSYSKEAKFIGYIGWAINVGYRM